MPKVTDFRWLFLMAIPPGSLPVFEKAPRRIFVYIAAILVYKATDTATDTEQQEERHAGHIPRHYHIMKAQVKVFFMAFCGSALVGRGTRRG